MEKSKKKFSDEDVVAKKQHKAKKAKNYREQEYTDPDDDFDYNFLGSRDMVKLFRKNHA